MAHRFPVASLMALPTISQYRVSPAGERIAFVRDTTGGNELYVLDIKSETVTRVSDGELHDEHPGPVMWAPDGERIYFQRPPADDGIQTIDTVDMAGTVERVLAAEGTVHLEDVRPDGNALLLHFLDSGDEPLDRDLYRYDSTTGETVRLTEYDHPVRSRNLFSPEGNRISYQVYRIVEGQQQSDPYVVDADGTSPRQLAFGEENSDSRIVDWHPDGRRLLVMDDATGTYRSGVYDLDTDDVRWAGDAPFDVRPMAFRPDGGGFLARHYREVTTVPAVYTLDGEGRELPLDGGVADYPTWVKPHDDIFLSDG
ncbi:MAG: TolB family protein, partial [Halobacteriaceae archaeon]